MSHFLKYVVIAAIIATGIVFATGLVTMFAVKKRDAQRSQERMGKG